MCWELEFAEGTYKQKKLKIFYRIGGFHGRIKAKGYSEKYLELYHHENPLKQSCMFLIILIQMEKSRYIAQKKYRAVN